MGSFNIPSSLDFTSFSNVINGELRSSETFHQAVNPSNREPLWKVPAATEQDLNDAVNAAQKAFPEWAATSWTERQGLLRQAQERILSHKDGLAQLLVDEVGKPIPFAAREVSDTTGFLDFYANQAEILPKEIIDTEAFKVTQRWVPVGVTAAICPWNFPLVLAAGKLAPALLTGNPIIIKPSPFTPYSILKVVELIRDIFPPGVLQAFNGDDSMGPLMCTHPGISKISFTGSIPTGKKVMAAASRNLKSVTLELGGNSASIICPDVDVDIVAPEVSLGSFFNSGQLCAASKRVYVHKDIYDEFLLAMVNQVKSWKVAPAATEGAILGPVQNEMQYNIVKRIFDDTVSNGYKFALGGEIKDANKDLVIQPAIIDRPPDDAMIVKEEPFGPIVPILSWSDEDELIQRVNDTNTGLGGAVWSSDIPRAERIASKIEAGTIWINSFEKPLPMSHFAGHKESGIGGEWGEQGLYSYLQPKSIQFWKMSVGKSAK